MNSDSSYQQWGHLGKMSSRPKKKSGESPGSLKRFVFFFFFFLVSVWSSPLNTWALPLNIWRICEHARRGSENWRVCASQVVLGSHCGWGHGTSAWALPWAQTEVCTVPLGTSTGRPERQLNSIQWRANIEVNTRKSGANAWRKRIQSSKRRGYFSRVLKIE